MNDISIPIAFVAGILSFVSPCVLPLVPAYISFLSGFSLQELQDENKDIRVTRKTFFASLFFVIGFSCVFVALGASATLLGRMLYAYMSVITKVAGVFIIILGFHILGLLKIKWLSIDKHFHLDSSKGGLLSAFVLGIAFAFGWSPCVGPILAGVLALASQEDTMARGIVLLIAYSAGLGLPFLLTGAATGFFIRFFNKYKRFVILGKWIAGVLVICIGALIFADNLDAVKIPLMRLMQ